MIEPELEKALAQRDTIIDTILALAEYRPGTRKRDALTWFLVDGRGEQAMPIQLRRVQTKVLELL